MKLQSCRLVNSQKFSVLEYKRKETNRNRKEATKAAKRLRLMKKKKSTKLLAKEVREGSTYETSIDNNTKDHDVEEIPDPLKTPEIEKFQ